MRRPFFSVFSAVEFAVSISDDARERGQGMSQKNDAM
jgi:hypothetical protein